jgi:hypothetical protein
MDAPYMDPYPTPSGQPLLDSKDAPDSMVAQRTNLLKALQDYLRESRNSAYEWQVKAKKAWDMIHGRIDWSHKAKDQSKVHMNRVGLAQEQIKAQLRQGLVNFEDWLVVETEKGFESPLMTEGEAKRLVLRCINRTDPQSKIVENIGIAAVENLLATKLQPVVIEKKGPGGKVRKEFHIDMIPLNVRSYYPDARFEVTAAAPLYQFHEVQLNKYQVVALASETPDKKKPYRMEIAKNLQPKRRIEEQKESQDRGNDVLQDATGRRQIVTLHEFYGTVLNDRGEVMTWKNEDGSELELRDVMCVMANEGEILMDPVAIPFWDKEGPFVVTQLLKTNINMYGKSLLAPGVDMNRAEDELINAAIDAGLKEGYNVNILKIRGLEDKRQAEGGIKYGMTLLQNNQLAPGEKVLDTVQTGHVPQGLLTVLDRVRMSGSENMRLNEISLTGQLQSKQTRATEITASSQTIQGLFESIDADLEDVYIEKMSKKCFLMGLQYADLLDEYDLEYIFYGNKARIEAFTTAAKKPQIVYDELACSFRFRGKGVRSLAANAHQAQALVQLFGMVASNPVILDMFERQGLCLPLMFDDIMKGFHLDMQRYYDTKTQDFAMLRQKIREEALAFAEAMASMRQQQTQQMGQPQGPSGAGPQPAQPTAQPAGMGMQPGMGAGSGGM